MKKELIPEIILRRRSVRTYDGTPLSAADRTALTGLIQTAGPGPFGSTPRYAIVSPETVRAVDFRKLGTYGFISAPAAFIAGAARREGMSNEDFGFVTEGIVLECTALGLGTCWLGGTFSRSLIAKEIGTAEDEMVPAILAVGYGAGRQRSMEKIIRWGAGADDRKPFSELFFHRSWGIPLDEGSAGALWRVLPLLQRAPSASNKQPWRVILDGNGKDLHLYCRRTPGYRGGYASLLGFEDLQRVDMGIAMCHFQAGADHFSIKGKWRVSDPGFTDIPEGTEYIASWIG